MIKGGVAQQLKFQGVTRTKDNRLSANTEDNFIYMYAF